MRLMGSWPCQKRVKRATSGYAKTPSALALPPRAYQETAPLATVGSGVCGALGHHLAAVPPGAQRPRNRGRHGVARPDGPHAHPGLQWRRANPALGPVAPAPTAGPDADLWARGTTGLGRSAQAVAGAVWDRQRRLALARSGHGGQA